MTDFRIYTLAIKQAEAMNLNREDDSWDIVIGAFCNGYRFAQDGITACAWCNEIGTEDELNIIEHDGGDMICDVCNRDRK